MTAVPPRVRDGGHPRISGHRGAAGTEPENTVRSFQRAIALGAGTVELDLQRSADGELIVIHDETVDRTTGGAGRVNDLTLADIRLLRADGEPVPTFTEVLDSIDAPIQVEVKDPLAVEPLIALLRARPEIGRRVVLSGFSEEVLRQLAEAVPDVPRGLICRGYEEGLLGRLADLGCEVVYSGWPGLTVETVQALHDAGVSIAAWNVNTREELALALALGVDEISSDFPGEVARWLGSASG